MKHYFNYIIILLVSLLPLGCLQTVKYPKTRAIPVEADKIINESGSGNASYWFDEQDTSLIPSTRWETPGSYVYWPASILIDLGETCRIKGIAVFDGKKSGNNGDKYEHEGGELEIQSGVPFHWQKERVVQLSNDGQWHYYKFDLNSRWIRLVKSNTERYKWESSGPYVCDLNINEVIFYGHKPDIKNSSPDKQVSNPRPSYSIDQFIGVNANDYSNPRYLIPFGSLRDPIPLDNYETKNLAEPFGWKVPHKYHPENSHQRLTNKVLISVLNLAEQDKAKEVKTEEGNNSESVSSFSLISGYSFRFAERFGNIRVQNSMLRTQEENTPEYSLGIVNYLEAYNKPDPAKDYRTPYEIAAMASAVYDGHNGIMGKAFGVRQADPSMKVVLPGLNDLTPSYPKAIKFWSDYFRKGSFPADVISFHHFCITSSKTGDYNESCGISPEADNLKSKLLELVNWNDQNLPDKEIWLSEFGWDSKKGSPYSAMGHKNWENDDDTEELQGIWLVRALLIGAASGLDRMQIYKLKDENEDGPLSTCGLIDRKGQPKKSWYYVSTLYYALHGLYFTGEKPSGVADVWIYEFSAPYSGKTVYAIWSPTSDGTQVTGYKVHVEDKPNTSAFQIELKDGMEKGNIKPINLTHGTAKINVTEKPTFILLENKLITEE